MVTIDADDSMLTAQELPREMSIDCNHQNAPELSRSDATQTQVATSLILLGPTTITAKTTTTTTISIIIVSTSAHITTICHSAQIEEIERSGIVAIVYENEWHKYETRKELTLNGTVAMVLTN